MLIGEVIAKKRDERGITYAELARRTNIQVDVLCRICNGKSMPKGDQLIRLCKELKLDVTDFEE